MSVFIAKRLGLALITLWILSLIVFFAGQVLPGDPGRAILGPLAAQSAVEAAQPPARRRPAALTQYWDWISGFVHGDMGTSYQFRAPVRAVHQRGASASRSSWRVVAFVLVVPLSILGGVVAALNVGKAPDRIITVLGLSVSTRARVRLRDRAHHRLRDLAERAADLGARGRRGASLPSRSTT